MFAPGETGARTTRGVVRNAQGGAVPTTGLAGAIFSAVVYSEGNDALICSSDGGATLFPVMKPHPLRVSRMLVYSGSVLMGDFLALVTQNTNMGYFETWGFVMRFQNKAFLPQVVEQDMTVWPTYLDLCTTTGLNLIRENTFDTSVQREIMVAESTGCGKVNSTDLMENILGDTPVNHVDITPGRTWRAIDEIYQSQVVTDTIGGTALGIVDNSPLNTA